jgi:hypothetical protein
MLNDMGKWGSPIIKTMIMKEMLRVFILSTIVAVSACDSVNTGGPKANKAPLVGTWRLVKYVDFDTVTKTWKHPYGEHPKGYFTYTGSGIVNLNGSAEAPLVIPPDSEYIKPMTLGAVLDNAWGYFGTYSIDSVHSIVTHHVKGGSVINYIGTDQHRQFILKGDTLLLGDPTFEIGKRVLVREE